MRASDIEEPVSVATARLWATGKDPLPPWCSELIAQATARSARKLAVDAAARLEAEHAELLRRERVFALLAEGRRKRFRDSDMDVVTEVAFRAAQELARMLPPDCLSPAELSALRVCGINPHRHDTWPLHAGDCDGQGESCDQRAAALAAERFECAEESRHARREFSADARDAIATGKVAVGDYVSMHWGSRAGRVVALNKATVVVRVVSTLAQGHVPIDAKASPQHLVGMSDAATAVDVGQTVRFRDWGGRLREGVVAEVDWPIFRVDYTLASRASRSTWFDVQRLSSEAPA